MIGNDPVKQTLDFCQRWIEKADDYGDQLLSDAFHEFFSLFVAYNRLYCHMFPNAGDREAATKLFARRVGHDTIWSKVSEGPGLDDLNCLRTLIAPRGKVLPFRTFRYSHARQAQKRRASELDSDSSGGPTASIEGKPLDTQGIIDEMITPLRIAVGDIPDA